VSARGRGARTPLFLCAAARLLARRGVVARSRAKAHSLAPPCLGLRPASTALCKRVTRRGGGGAPDVDGRLCYPLETYVSAQNAPKQIVVGCAVTRRCLVRGVGESFPDRSQVGRQPARDRYKCHYRGRANAIAPAGAARQAGVQGRPTLPRGPGASSPRKRGADRVVERRVSSSPPSCFRGVQGGSAGAVKKSEKINILCFLGLEISISCGIVYALHSHRS